MFDLREGKIGSHVVTELFRQGRIYILDAAGKPVRPKNLQQWAQWFVNFNTLGGEDGVTVSTPISDNVAVVTSFSGVDEHSEENDPVPYVWETRIVGGPLNDYCGKFQTREDALAAHPELVRSAQEAQNNPSGAASKQKNKTKKKRR